MHKRHSGFTLIEVVIVLAIMAILLAIMIPSLLSARIAGNEARVKQELNDLIEANNQTKLHYGKYSPSLETFYGDHSFDQDYVTGYQFVDYQVTANGWSVRAEPSVPGQTGETYFYASQKGILENPNGPVVLETKPTVGE